MKPLEKVKIRWSPKLAYVIGLLTTDGSLNKDGRHIDFTSKDIQLIKTFKNCLGIKNKIGLKSSGFSERKYFHVQFGDVIFYRWLLEIGLTPNKSKTIGEIKIPDAYFSDFLRGHFDGDGCCYSYWDKRWRSSFMFYITFISASKEHMLWLREKIDNLIRIKGHFCTTKTGQMSQLRYAKEESKILFSTMYYKKRLPHLKRKYKKLHNILNIDGMENHRKQETD